MSKRPRDTVHHSENWVPTVARLDIPLGSVVNLRRVAGELRALAERLDVLSRDPADSAEVLFEAGRATRHTAANLRKIRRPGRPAKRVHSLRWPIKI
jgi:hypothetical protein